jgi:hypothetical protein
MFMTPTDMLDLLSSELKNANAFGKGLYKNPEKMLRSGFSKTARIAKSLAKMLKAQDFGGLDDFFFRREELVPGGKEYWFIDVVSTQGDKAQLVLTFGCSDAKASVNSHETAAGTVAAVGWFYSDKKKVFLDKSVVLDSAKGLLQTSAFTFSGKYPSYDLVVDRKTHLHFTKQKKGIAYEAHPCTAKDLGVGLLNMYLDAKGQIDGKPFKGVGYVQKVVVVAPFIPWNWLRVVFKDKSVLDVFVARLSVKSVEYRVLSTSIYRLASGKTFNLSGSRFKKLEGDRWLLEGDGFAAYLKTYAFKPFMLRGRGEFHYDEYLVECTDFVYKGKELQGGIGMIEDAYGFMI